MRQYKVLSIMHQVLGKVVKGIGYGKVLGFPTANLDRRDFVRKKLQIKHGVYAGFAIFKLKAKSYKLKAGIVIGPLDTLALPKIEAHLIGFKGNLYGQKLSLSLVKYLRPFKKYRNEEQLKIQIKRDIEQVKAKLYKIYGQSF